MFAVRESAMPLPAGGEVLVRSQFLSIDPWLLPLLRSLPTGATVPGEAIGRVVYSRHPFFRAGEVVHGPLGWQQHSAVPWYLLRKVDSVGLPVSTALGILGASGVTAFVGLFEIARLRPGDIVAVSAAAGAVGSAAAQLAKLAGCRVIGIAGSPEKVRYLTGTLQLDAAVDYRGGGWQAALRTECPFGVDVYFDNVGGRVSDAVGGLLNPHARVAVCGQIAEYARPSARTRWPWLAVALEKRVRIQGFLVSDFPERYAEALGLLRLYVCTGLITYRETMAHGIENAPAAFIGMLQGVNIGKQIVVLP